MKKRIVLLSAFMFILVIIFICFKFIIQPYIAKIQFEKNIVSFLNDDGKSNITNYTKWLKYAKNERLEEYDISGIINDYISVVEIAMQKRINPQKIIKHNEYYKSGSLDVVSEHGIRNDWIEYITNNITDEDIVAYNENSFYDKLLLRIEEVFIHKSTEKDKDWYIKNDIDKTVELPYNVYYVFVSDQKKLKREVKKIISINTVEVSKHSTDCKVKYKNFNDEVIVKNIELFNSVNMYTGEKTYFYSDFSELYYTNNTNPTLTAGQHDYDAEVERIRKEYPLEGPSTFTNAWEEEIQGITYEPSKVLTMEEMYRTLLEIFRESTDSEAKKQVEILEEKLEELADNN